MSKLTLCPGPGALMPLEKFTKKFFGGMIVKKLKKEHLIGYLEYHQKI